MHQVVLVCGTMKYVGLNHSNPSIPPHYVENVGTALRACNENLLLSAEEIWCRSEKTSTPSAVKLGSVSVRIEGLSG